MKSLSTILPITTCLLVPLFGYSTAATSWAQGYPDCCVVECTDDPGVDVMELVAAGQCIPEPTGPDECTGPFLEVELRQRDLDQLVVGYQAFMCFNPRYIRVCDIELTESPYGLHMINEWDNELGTITLIAGIDEMADPPQEPTDKDAVLAIIRIEGLAEFCEFDPDLANQICFREHLPPTRFSDPDGLPVYPCLKFTGNLFIDWTEPDCTCPRAVTVQCVDEVPDADCDLVVCTDDCDPKPACTWEGDTDNGGAGCPDDPRIITRKYRCTDFCENYCECTQTITVVDNTPPEITCPDPVGVECYEDVPEPDPGLVAVTDNCDDAPDVTWVRDYDNEATGCPGDPRIIVRTYRATDFCGNYSDCQQIITVVDTTPPVIECPADEGYECVEDVPDPDVTLPVVSDNCDHPEPPDVTHEGDVDNGGSGCEDDPLIIRRTYRATDFCGNFSECIQTITVVDTTDPEIICPPAENYQCVEEVPDYDPNNPDPRIQVSDNCWDPNDPNSPAPVVTWEGDEDNAGDGCPDSPLIITRTYRVTDVCQNFSECQQIITVIDTTPPEIWACPHDVEVECVQDVPEPNLEGVCFADNCWDPDDPNSSAPVVTHEGDVDNGGSGCDGDPLIITRTFRVTDFCGNYSECPQEIKVIDRSPPEFPDGCQPLYVTVYPNAGDCDAFVCLPVPPAVDNCDDDVEVVGERSDGLALDEAYPPGETTVWWTAADDCGNQNLCFQFVEVMDENLLVAHVELQGIFVSPLSRCITFELWNCPADEPVHTADRVITFVTNNVDRSAGTTELHVPCALYNCMTAQDRLHTLRSTAELGIIEYTDEFTCPDMVRTKYSAEYRNPRPDGECEYPSELGHWLLSGNFDFCNWPDDCEWPDCDYWVDILDFGVWWNQFNAGANYGTGDTTCPACDQFMHADANGDALCTIDDFAYFRVNLLCAYEPNCCGAPGAADRGPIMSISVEELHARGWDELAGADLNHDGWLDMQDVEAFENGGWEPEVSPSEGGQPLDPDDVRRP